MNTCKWPILTVKRSNSHWFMYTDENIDIRQERTYRRVYTYIYLYIYTPGDCRSAPSDAGTHVDLIMYPCVNTDVCVTDVYIGVYIRTHTCIFTWKLPIRTIGRSNSSCSARLKIPRYQSTLTFILYVQTIIKYVRTQTHEYVCVYVFRSLLYHMYKQPTLLYTYTCQNIYKYIYVCIYVCIDVTCITSQSFKTCTYTYKIRTRLCTYVCVRICVYMASPLMYV